MEKLIPYPIKVQPKFIKKLWGGKAIKTVLNKNAGNKTWESLEIYDMPDYSNKVINGEYQGMKLSQLVSKYRYDLIGDFAAKYDRIPLIVKFLDISDRLSLQVHPTDEYARKNNLKGGGKSECWYIIKCTGKSKIARGLLPGTSKKEFLSVLDSDKVFDCLNVLNVKKGEIVYLPAGTLHCAWGELLVLEIQNSSDVTFRITDWDRKDSFGKKRKLELEKGLQCIEFDSLGVIRVKPSDLQSKGFRHRLLLKTEKFTIEHIEVTKLKPANLETSNIFKILTVISGRGKIEYGDNFKDSESYSTGISILIPASLKEYRVNSSTKTTEAIICYC